MFHIRWTFGGHRASAVIQPSILANKRADIQLKGQHLRTLGVF